MVSQNTANDYCHSSDALSQYGTRECHYFREAIFDKHFRLSRSLRTRYQSIAANESHVTANTQLRGLDERLSVKGRSLLDTQGSVEQIAKEQSSLAVQLCSSNNNEQSVFNALSNSALSCRITPPDPKDFNGQLQACINRLC